MTHTSDRLEREFYLDWWGLLRRPPIYLDVRLKRIELIWIGMLVGTALLLLCWGALFWFTASTTLGVLTIVAANAVGCAALASHRGHF